MRPVHPTSIVPALAVALDICLLAGVLACVVPAAAAQSAGGDGPPDGAPALADPGGPSHRKGPPPQALAACQSQAAAAACSFTTPRGDSLAGTCWAPQGKPLACKPQHPPAPPGGASAGQP
jgi:hypothetical protein